MKNPIRIAMIKSILKKIVKGYLRDLYWQIYGKSIKNPKLPKDLKSILYVCKGNICRSPFAEYLGRRLLESRKIEGVVLGSAGLEVSKSVPSPEEAIEAAKSFGVCLNGHTSRRINDDILGSFDMIVVMENGELKTLRRSFPQFKNRFFLLPIFEKNTSKPKGTFLQYNITDPYGKELNQFLACYQRIERCLEGMFDQIVNRGEVLSRRCT